MQNVRTVCIAVLSLLLLVALPLNTLAAEQKAAKTNEDIVVAFVNKKPVMKRDYESEVSGTMGQFQARGRVPSENELKEIQQAALNKVISVELLLQASVAAGIQVSEQAVDAQFQQFKKQFPSDSVYQQVMTDNGLSEKNLRAQFSRNMAIQQFITNRFAKGVSVSEADARIFYDENKPRFKKPDQVRARHILMKVEEDDSTSKKEKKRAKLEKIRKQIIETKADFAEMAKRFSEGPSGERGGDLGFFQREDMVPPFSKAAFGLMPGDVSEVVETQFGFHIIKVEEKKFAEEVEFETVKNNIIGYLTDQQVSELVGAFLSKKMKSAEIKIVAADLK